ncbi:MAG: formimidoylglutamase [Phycisphaerales bacterium JB037]
MALIGLADDEGVRLNGGRLGARGGPDAIRAALCRYGAADAAMGALPGVFDCGNINPGADLEETHDRVSEAVGWALDRGLFPIGLGGGHDLTWALGRAVAERCDAVDCVYFDAHLDVRAELGSGMPFRALVERASVRSLRVLGMDPLANTREHLRWFEAHGGHAGALDDHEAWSDADLIVSLDLDVIDQAFAPGVSATNPHGWTPGEVERKVIAAARQANLRSFDIMELCPAHDEGGRTARLAARLLLVFLTEFGRARA